MNNFTKKEIRTFLKYSRNNLDKNYVDNASEIISEKLIKFIEENNMKTIMSYMSFGNEVITNRINNFILESQRNLILPKVMGDKIIPIKVTSLDNMNLSSFGIEEPLGENYADSIDLVIVPGLGFNPNGNRIGFGKGYYDRFLENKKTYKIGICFLSQLMLCIPMGSHDIKMDMVISDTGNYLIKDL